MFNQNTHCHDRNWVITPPQRGPITAPDSAAAPTSPNGKLLSLSLNRSPIIAIEIGTKAPAPIA